MKKIHLIEITALNPDEADLEQFKLQSLGLGYLASYAEKYGGYKNIKIYRSESEIRFNEVPDIVGISSVTQYFEIAKKLAHNIKKKYKKVIIIMGGVHVSLMPLSAPKDADYLVIGEGEQTFLELLDHITKHEHNIEDIRGLYYKKNNEFVFTGPRELIKNLDIIPFPKRSEQELRNTDSIRLFSSRGCPYHCPFCAASKLWKTLRFHSFEYVIKEVELLIETYHAKEVYFNDDLFVAHKTRLEMIVNEIEKRGWNKKVTFKINCRADMITKQSVQLLKRMNVRHIMLGLESGSPRMLKIMKNSTVTIQQNYKAVRLLKKAKIRVGGFFMIGYPGETIKDIDATINFIKKSDIDEIGVGITTPFPGTDLWYLALKKGVVSENMDWSLFQIDFAQDMNRAPIIADLDRKVLFKKYTEFLRLFLHKNLEESKDVSLYFKRLSFKYIFKLIKNPKKILFGIEIVFTIIFKKMLKFKDYFRYSKKKTASKSKKNLN